eukprot:UN05023
MGACLEWKCLCVDCVWNFSHPLTPRMEAFPQMFCTCCNI